MSTSVLDRSWAAKIELPIWLPNPGPQFQALRCQADVLLYGGAAGGGKSDVLIGMALTEAHRTRLFRRHAVELNGSTDRSIEILGHRNGFVAGPVAQWRLPNGRSIEFGHMQNPGDEQKYQGRARDLMAFDEAAHFLEAQVEFVSAWLRDATQDCRTRLVLASNPPMTGEGEWLIDWFAPWLDLDFPEPAEPGELRWCVRVDGDALWVGGPGDIEIDGAIHKPLSYTFIPAKVSDNPDLSDKYLARLHALPEPRRSRLLEGNFILAGEDDPGQLIPTDWIEAAQDRWDASGWRGANQTALGVDIAQGGDDRTVIVACHDWWIEEPVILPGDATPDGNSVLTAILPRLRNQARVNVDTGGVYGSSTIERLADAGIRVSALVSSKASLANDRTGNFGFANKRAEWWWALREALDPHTSILALPPGREVLADLVAPRWKVRSGKVLIEAKEDIRKRLGRSPDIGDAIVYACADEPLQHAIDGTRGEQIRSQAAAIGGRTNRANWARRARRARAW